MKTKSENKLQEFYEDLWNSDSLRHAPQPYGAWTAEMARKGLSYEEALYLIAFLASKANL